jgi:hypothetical protein
MSVLLKGVKLSELEKIKADGSMCAWRGCTERVKGDLLPKGWWRLLCYEAPRPMLNILKPKNWHLHRRDGVLCPEHAFLFDQMLKPLLKSGEELELHEH